MTTSDVPSVLSCMTGGRDDTAAPMKLDALPAVTTPAPMKLDALPE